MRRKEEFSLLFLLDILTEKKIFQDERVRQSLLFSESKISSRILASMFPTAEERRFAKYTPSPVEIFLWFTKTAPEIQITEDEIMQIVAEKTSLPYIKLDPLRIDTNIAIRYTSRNFARINVICPLYEKEGAIHIATDNPFNEAMFEDLKLTTKLDVKVHVASKSDILKIVNEIFGFNVSVKKAEQDYTDVTTQKLSNLESLFTLKSIQEIDANDKHIVNAVDYLLTYATNQKASDIHIEPKRDLTKIRLRIDGVLHTIQSIPATLHPAFVSRLKGMARMDISEKRKPQDGRIKIQKDDKEIELRISTLPVAFGEKIVIRIFDPELLFQELESLGFFKDDYSLYKSFINRPNGLILITGPTGSGKTTTLYSSLKTRVDESVNIVTIEDPIEMIYEHFNQVAVNPKIDLTFANALRTILRQDPDIIMVGEIRDKETAQNAIQAALTGHLVFASLHTNDSLTSIDRLIDLGIDPFMIATTLIGAIAQRLVRKICSECKIDTSITKEEAAVLGLKLPPERDSLKTFKGNGCPICRGTGFVGRSAVYELFEITPKIKQLIISGDLSEIAKNAKMDGMKTLREQAVRKLAQGITSYEEILRVIF
ncbi:type II/IV secretion system protein [bacterium]|nr:type II/IV secretion system protein [bacterium]